MYFLGDLRSHFFHEEEYTKQGKGANQKGPHPGQPNEGIFSLTFCKP